jgi:hypothetical protein
LNAVLTEVFLAFEKEIHLMLPNSPDVLPQSSNMFSLSTLTTWQIIYLLLL